MELESSLQPEQTNLDPGKKKRNWGSKGRKWKPLSTQAALTEQLLSEIRVYLAFGREVFILPPQLLYPSFQEPKPHFP